MAKYKLIHPFCIRVNFIEGQKLSVEDLKFSVTILFMFLLRVLTYSMHSSGEGLLNEVCNWNMYISGRTL